MAITPQLKKGSSTMETNTGATTKLDAVHDKLSRIDQLTEGLCNQISNNDTDLNGCETLMFDNGHVPEEKPEPDGFFEQINFKINIIIDRLLYAGEKEKNLLRFRNNKLEVPESPNGNSNTDT